MRAKHESHDERITRDIAILGGKPVVRGTRIAVEKILEQLAFNPEIDEVFAIWPEIDKEDVQACLAYATAAVSRVRSPRVSSRLSA